MVFSCKNPTDHGDSAGTVRGASTARESKVAATTIKGLAVFGTIYPNRPRDRNTRHQIAAGLLYGAPFASRPDM